MQWAGELDFLFDKGDNAEWRLPSETSSWQLYVAHSSRGLGHLPLKEEITGSNPVCATTCLQKLAASFQRKVRNASDSLY